jgi:hypothetical protein
MSTPTTLAIADNAKALGSSTGRHIVWHHDGRDAFVCTIDGRHAGTVTRTGRYYIADRADDTEPVAFDWVAAHATMSKAEAIGRTLSAACHHVMAAR